ncbi:hypothetical protein GCM10009016_26750 [Halomonas beimenensis]
MVLTVSLRTLERACESYCQALAAEDKATVRFETPPRKQLQIDFGSRQIVIGGESVKVYLFVATLGYSRRHYVRAFRHERQSAWFAGLEGAFRHFGGVPEQVLLDNAKGWSITTTPLPARWCSTRGWWPLPITGASGRWPVHLTAPVPRARTSAASAT